MPLPLSSVHVTHGTVTPPGASVPGATRASSASWPGAAFREQRSSRSVDSAQGPKPWAAPLASSGLTWPAVPRPTTTQRKPPSAAASGTALAAKTCSLPRRPMPLAPCSYQTIHGTVSRLPVKAKSGSMPSRVGSTFSDGSSAAGVGAAALRRLTPVCRQQNWLTLVPPPGWLAAQRVCLIAREAKIWFLAAASVAAPSFSCHATRGTGSLPATAAPPTSAGFSAVRSVWMFSDGIACTGARSWPSGTQTFAAALKRLAKMFVAAPAARFELGSYQAVHGTVRPKPAKSIDGASASWLAWMLSDWPWVTKRPPLNARTKTCCEAPVFCSNAAHGTFGAPAASEPAATSETPASWLGSTPERSRGGGRLQGKGRRPVASLPLRDRPHRARFARPLSDHPIAARPCGHDRRPRHRPPHSGAVRHAGRGAARPRRAGRRAPGSRSGRRVRGRPARSPRDRAPRAHRGPRACDAGEGRVADRQPGGAAARDGGDLEPGAARGDRAGG